MKSCISSKLRESGLYCEVELGSVSHLIRTGWRWGACPTLVLWVLNVRLAALCVMADAAICLYLDRSRQLCLYRQVRTCLWTCLSLEASRVTEQGLQWGCPFCSGTSCRQVLLRPVRIKRGWGRAVGRQRRATPVLALGLRSTEVCLACCWLIFPVGGEGLEEQRFLEYFQLSE